MIYKNQMKLTMKKIYLIVILGLAIISVKSQVVLGGKTSVEGSSTILDFNNVSANSKGIILSSVQNINKALSQNPVENNGTFLFDKSDRHVKMYQNNTWINLSGPINPGINPTNPMLINTSAETDGTVIIGNTTSPAKGALVLESSNKAMILPRISSPHLNVKSPYTGMMCYDLESKSLALFDGAVWHYWK
jgi:hypothetical protein